MIPTHIWVKHEVFQPIKQPVKDTWAAILDFNFTAATIENVAMEVGVDTGLYKTKEQPDYSKQSTNPL